MTTRTWTPSANATRIHIDVVDSDDHYPRLVVDSEVAVELSAAFRLYFPNLAAYDAWWERLDRNRAALGTQQTFGDAS
jgi:hypothetical protein